MAVEPPNAASGVLCPSCGKQTYRSKLWAKATVLVCRNRKCPAYAD